MSKHRVQILIDGVEEIDYVVNAGSFKEGKISLSDAMYVAHDKLGMLEFTIYDRSKHGSLYFFLGYEAVPMSFSGEIREFENPPVIMVTESEKGGGDA